MPSDEIQIELEDDEQSIDMLVRAISNVLTENDIESAAATLDVSVGEAITMNPCSVAAYMFLVTPPNDMLTTKDVFRNCFNCGGNASYASKPGNVHVFYDATFLNAMGGKINVNVTFINTAKTVSYTIPAGTALTGITMNYIRQVPGQ